MILNNSYIKLPNHFYDAATPAEATNPKLIKFNRELSDYLGLNLSLKSDEELAQIFSGKIITEGSEPIALAYAAHQFGHFVPELGDGRAILLGEVVNIEGKRFDIQLKGSGITKYSRNGDGLAALGPVIREYIVSEAMFRLGIPTTRALAAVLTDDLVYRETPLPRAILTRVASSHLRIGTFQYALARQDQEGLIALLDYAIERHYPEIKNAENKALSFLLAVANAQIKLIASWMSVGFIHGVMNTDNMTISGETIDYGPCAFMDHFNFNQVYSYIDRNGRYAYGNQPKILLWNLYRLADCLIPLIDKDEKVAIEILNKELSQIPLILQREINTRFAKKLGLVYQEGEEDIIQAFLEYLQESNLDFTLSFRNLLKIFDEEASLFFIKSDSFNKFKTIWRQKIKEGRVDKALMEKVNPTFIPRNHHIEAAIRAALNDDYSIFHEINEVLKNPYQEQEKFIKYSLPPEENQKIKNTFCGT